MRCAISAALARGYAEKLRSTRWLTILGLTLGLATNALGSAGAQLCPGDCNDDGQVTIEELVLAVEISLGTTSIDTCTRADANADGVVSIDELVVAIRSAIEGCTDGSVIVFEHPDLQPEGIEYDATRGMFIVGSRTMGTILTVSDDGMTTELVSSPGLSSTLGLHIDLPGGRLLAAGAFDAANALGLGIYDLETGAVLDVVDMSSIAPPGGHFANDVVTDSAGNAYVTDTIAAAVYRVAPDGSASLLSNSGLLAGANGIEIYDDRLLLVATLPGPQLVRIPLDDPASVGTVATEIPVSGDGIVFEANGDLAIVGAFTNSGMVLRLRSDDGWATATLVGTWDALSVNFGQPTTAAVRGDEVHVIFAHLFDTTRTQYEIVRADFE